MKKVEKPFIDYDFELNRFSKYMKALRLTIGYTSTEFATILGISRTTFKRYEEGYSTVTPLIYLGFRGVFLDTALRIENGDLFEELWWCMVEGLNQDNSEFSEEDADLINAAILRIGNDPKKCPRCFGPEYAQQIILKELFDVKSPWFEEKNNGK